ncbi:MAG: hypothetical protein QOF33_2272 [Thermomicrobiales bacterium]|nr:hypothetical protein [Thermomicrobiales bacterium]MEA2584187.1 hypothetical protein [Thermomicrobiales bacterium]
MKVVLSGETYRKLCVVVAVAVFSSNFANYSERWGYKPLYWVGLLGVLTAPLLAGAALTKRVPIRPLMVWCAGFLLISIAWYFPSKQNAIAYQEVETRFLSVIFLLLVLFLCARPAEQHLARVMIALSVLLGVGLNLYEVFHPLTFSKIPGRSSGLFENSNQSGAALILGMIIAYAVVPSRVRLPFIVLTGIGILTTFSRAAMIGWILVVLLLVVRAGFGVRQARALLVFGAIVVAFIFSPLWGNVQGSLEERGILNLNNLQRLTFFRQGNLDDQSAEGRKQVAQVGWRLFGEKPLAGHGTGSFRVIEDLQAGVHNIYVALLIDHGILGLFIIPSLLLATLWGANAKTFDVVGPFMLFIAMWGFFSHNVLEERYILLSIALTAALVAGARTRPMESRAAEPKLAPLGAVASA